MRLGAHISTAAPFSESIIRAKELGCDCMQIFVNAPQRWNPSPISEAEINRFIKLNETAKIEPIISHTIYLISFSGLNPFYYQASQRSVIDEMEKAKRLGLLGVNTHLGSSKDKTFSEVLDNVVTAIKNVLTAVPDGPYFIIENSAGAGNIIGDSLDEIGQIVRGVSSHKLGERIKVLIDTAHAFESGYHLETKSGLEEFLAEFDHRIGLGYLVGLHLNDSITPFNSKKDRHADIGLGQMGIEAFDRIINHDKLKDLFGIIETPSLKGRGEIDNLEILRSLSSKM